MTTQLSPYKGLRRFEDSERDVPFFFGRERECALVTANLMASRLTVLYGETGVGKSSLLRAGVAHDLRVKEQESLARHGEPEHTVVVFDDWRDDPSAALRRACAEQVTRALGGSAPPPDDEAPLADAVRAWQQLLGGDLYVILDQLEEYFVYHRGDDAFAAEFPEIVAAPDLRVNFLLAIREDAVAKLDAFKPRIPNVLGNYLRLEHLDRAAAREAITGPVERWNAVADERAELEPALVDAVLDQVATGEHVETPHLQLVMQRLWDEERAVGSRVLRLATLTRLGGAAQIVGEHVTRALSELAPAEQDLAAAMFDHLVTPSGTKIALEVDDLARYAETRPRAVVGVLDKLGADRIVRSVSANGRGVRYEIFHDVLAQPVLAWTHAHDAERARRHMLRIVVLCVAAVAVMAGITVFALTQRSDARTQARIAGARAAAAEALTQLQIDPQRSLVLAIRAARADPTPDVADVLRQALLASQERAVLPEPTPPRAVSFANTTIVFPHRTLAARSPDGTLVAMTGNDHTITIRSASTHELVSVLHAGRGTVTDVMFSPGGKLLAATSTAGETRIWNAHTGVRTALLTGHTNAVVAAAFSAKGAYLATASDDATARIWQVRGGRLVAVLRGHRGPVVAVGFSPDSRWTATASSDGTVRVWEAGTAPELQPLGSGWGTVTVAALAAGPGRIAAAEGTTARVTRDGTTLVLRHPAAVRGIALGPDGSTVYTVDARGVVRAWDATGQIVRTGRGAPGPLDVSPDGTLLATTTALLDTHTLRPVRTLRGGPYTRVVFGPDGALLATAGPDDKARTWDARNGSLVRTFAGHTAGLTDVAFSSDGMRLATASSDHTARIWNLASGSSTVLRGHSGAVHAVAFSPDGTMLVTAGNTAAGLWTARDGRLVVFLHGGGVELRSVAFSRDGRTILTGGDDGVSAYACDACGGVKQLLRSAEQRLAALPQRYVPAG